MKKRISSLIMAIVMISTMMLAGCTPKNDTPAGDSATSDAGSSPSSDAAETPKGSGQVSVYTAAPEDLAQLFFETFEKETGIKVKGIRLSAGEIYARLQAEGNNPQASVWFMSSVETFNAAAEAGLLEKYSSPELANVSDKSFVDANGYWNPMMLQMLGILVNTDWLEENSVEAPKTWDDMQDPVYKDNIAIAHPATSGMSYMWLSAVIERFGEEEAFSYLNKLNSNIFQYSKSSNSPPQMVGLGEAAASFCYNTQAKDLIANGYKVDFIYPEDGTGYELVGMALIKNGPTEEQTNAKIFMDWLLSQSTQELIANEYNGIPVNNLAEVPDYLVSPEDVKLLEMDIAWISENRERLINKFETEIRGQENLS